MLLAEFAVVLGRARECCGVSYQMFTSVSVPCSWDEPLEAPAGATAEQVGVPRWRPGLTFGEFAELTVRDYYPPAAPAGVVL